MNAAEKWVIGLLAMIAALMFVFPVIVSKVPILGTQSTTGYDLFTSSAGDTALVGRFHLPDATESSDTRTGNPRTTPLSIRLAPMLRAWIAILFLGAIATIAGDWFSRGLAVAASAFGAALGIVAIVHVKLI